ncbi:MAG: DUF1835 domain-containing protein [Bacteroidota bacterium]|nr:DUF1835 domain-containing protein [Bacteroidota bacterium]
MIHIVFQEADVEVLQKAFELDETLQGDIVEIKDDYAVGPVENIYNEEGYLQRREWWKQLIDDSPYNTDHLMEKVDDQAAVERIIKALEENEEQEVWLWMGQNQHDVCGYYWLISQLQPYQGRIFVLYLNNLPFINEKGQLFYPTTLHQIQPKEFLKAKKLCRKVTPSEFEVDPDEWRKLMSENAFVRILEGGKKIVSKEADFYDKDILSALTSEWQKGNKAMHNILSKMKIKTGDIFLLWRIKQLVQLEQVEINGDTSKGWKDFEVRLKSLTAETVVSNPDQQ